MVTILTVPTSLLAFIISSCFSVYFLISLPFQSILILTVFQSSQKIPPCPQGPPVLAMPALPWLQVNPCTARISRTLIKKVL